MGEGEKGKHISSGSLKALILSMGFSSTPLLESSPVPLPTFKRDYCQSRVGLELIQK